jgi:hypothetical protein
MSIEQKVDKILGLDREGQREAVARVLRSAVPTRTAFIRALVRRLMSDNFSVRDSAARCFLEDLRATAVPFLCADIMGPGSREFKHTAAFALYYLLVSLPPAERAPLKKQVLAAFFALEDKAVAMVLARQSCRLPDD